jgi:iron complex outermembrane receptor protein
MRYLFIYCMEIIISTSSFGQVGGIILDASNHTPLPDATIIHHDDEITVSDSTGRFELSVSTFPDTLHVHYIGYESKNILITKPEKELVIELKASNFMLGEVVVTAYDSRRILVQSPASISLVSEKDFKLDNDVTMVPALNRVPGIYMHSGTYNTSRLTIRGIGSRSLFGTSKIRAYYEGIPLTSGDGETSVEDIDPNLIDRIEIIKGPSSSLYGAGLGGTLLIKAKSAANLDKSLKYQITGGSFGYLKNGLSLDYGAWKHRLSVNADHIHSNGWRENNEFRRFSAGITYQANLSAQTRLDFIGNYIDLKAFIPSSIDKETYDNNPRAAAPTWKEAEGFEDYGKYLTGLALNHSFSERSELNANVFLSGRNSYERRPFNILTEDTKATGGRARYQYHHNGLVVKMDLMAGLEYFIDFYSWKTHEIIVKEQGALLTDNHEKREYVNIFLKSDFTLPTRTFITLGLNINRTNYDYQDIYSVDNEDNSGNYQFGTLLSPRVGITQPINDDIHIYINLSHGFSPPSLAETLTPEGNINPDIQPETGMNYEIGTKGQVFNNRLFYDLAFFTMHINNLIVARRTGEDAFVGVNAGKTVHNGMEFTLNYNFLNAVSSDKNFYGFITYTLADYSFKEFLDGDNDYSGNELTGIPRHVLNGGIGFRSRTGFHGNIIYQFVDKMPMRDDNSVFSDPYQLVNLKAGFSRMMFSQVNVDLYGIVNNLFDTHYSSMIMVNASAFGGGAPRYYYPGLPLNFYLGMDISYRF